tara:strand:- start:2 stop:196 length:195 start_codon:yes stop_codon:yes gene_type:complete
MNIGDLVKFRWEDITDSNSSGTGIVVDVRNITSSVTYEVYVFWSFLGTVGKNYSYQLEAINEKR